MSWEVPMAVDRGGGSMTSDRVRRVFGRIPKTRTVLATGVAFILLAGFAAVPAFAVHDVGVFELDGNATTGNHSGLPDDWDRVCFEVLGTGCTTTTGVSGSNTGVTFDQEPNRSTTIFTGGGSKDDLNIKPPPGPGQGWQWKNQGGLPDKDNLRDGFATRYTCTAPACTGTAGDSLLYFGADRFDNSGDAQIGFWFLQGDVSPKADGTFGPDTHKAGDVLILSDFTQGGGTPTIRIFAWDPTCSSGCNTADLVNNTLLPLGGGDVTPADCPSQSGDDFCAVVNSTTQSAPWTFKDKSNSTSFLPGEFYEGGLNVTALNDKFPGLSSECFASFFSETRSSASPDATLKDFIGGAFQPCESGIVTTPSATTIQKGQSVSDSAVVTGQGGGTPTGKVKFFICSPAQLNNSGQCATGGTQVIKNGSDATGEPLVADPADATKANATSGPFTPTSTGTWCFRGEYVPAPGSVYKAASDFATTECVTVVQASVTTSPTSSSVVLNGSPSTATVQDTATVVGSGAGTPTGSVVFHVCGPGTSQPNPLDANGECSTGGALVGSASGVGLDANGQATSATFAPQAVGHFCFRGDYVPAAGSPYNGASDFDKTRECFDVTDTSSASTHQIWLPNDRATISTAGGTTLNGEVNFTLYQGGTCSGTILYQEDTDAQTAGVQGFTLTNATSPAAVGPTTNTSVKVEADATVSWKVVFTSSDNKVANSTATCEVSTLDLTPNQ